MQSTVLFRMQKGLVSNFSPKTKSPKAFQGFPVPPPKFQNNISNHKLCMPFTIFRPFFCQLTTEQSIHYTI